MSIKHFSLSFLIPIIPVCFAWDGCVSNARTYTLADLDELLASISTDGYQWNKGERAAGPMQQLYLIGTHYFNSASIVQFLQWKHAWDPFHD